MVRWSRIRRATRSPIYTMAPKGRHPGPRWFWRHDIGCLEDVPGLMGCGGKAFSQGHCIWDTRDFSGKTQHQHLQSGRTTSCCCFRTQCASFMARPPKLLIFLVFERIVLLRNISSCPGLVFRSITIANTYLLVKLLCFCVQ